MRIVREVRSLKVCYPTHDILLDGWELNESKQGGRMQLLSEDTSLVIRTCRNDSWGVCC